MQWIKASELKSLPRRAVYARWGEENDPDAVKSTGHFQKSDSVFFWEQKGYRPVPKEKHNELYILDESPTPISPYWDKIAAMMAGEYVKAQGSHDKPCVTHHDFMQGFLKGASMQQLWVPVESGLPEIMREVLVLDHKNALRVDYLREEKFWQRSAVVTHWTYITPPGSNKNPIVEQWGKMRKVLKETHDMMNKALEYTDFVEHFDLTVLVKYVQDSINEALK
jgi:hypothetical protein